MKIYLYQYEPDGYEFVIMNNIDDAYVYYNEYYNKSGEHDEIRKDEIEERDITVGISGVLYQTEN